jgi:hypothetical protein
MRTLTLSLDNPVVENILSDLSKQRNKSIEKVAVELLTKELYAIHQDTNMELTYKTLDPDKYMSKIKYDVDAELNCDEDTPFSNVANSAEYIKAIRKDAWRQ